MPMAIPISPRTPDWRRKSEDISGKRRGERENQKMKEMFHLLEHLLFFRCKAGIW